MERNSFLGTGWSFPPTFQKSETDGCSVRMVSDVEDIRDSLTILFSTRPGERVMRPTYGSALEDLLFEPVNVSLITYVKDTIQKSILYYEPRIDLESVEVLADEILAGKLKIELQFSVRTTNSRFNYVYDFYNREATIAPII